MNEFYAVVVKDDILPVHVVFVYAKLSNCTGSSCQNANNLPGELVMAKDFEYMFFVPPHNAGVQCKYFTRADDEAQQMSRKGVKNVVFECLLDGCSVHVSEVESGIKRVVVYTRGDMANLKKEYQVSIEKVTT